MYIRDLFTEHDEKGRVPTERVQDSASEPHSGMSFINKTFYYMETTAGFMAKTKQNQQKMSYFNVKFSISKQPLFNSLFLNYCKQFYTK